jgi:tight adherence protein B
MRGAWRVAREERSLSLHAPRTTRHDDGGDVYLSLLIFASVAVGITAGYYALAAMLFGDATRVRQRVESEFRKDGDNPNRPKSALFKNLGQVNLDRTGSFADLELPEAGPPPAEAQGLRRRLRLLLEQANLRITLRQLLAVAVGLGLGVGAAATLLRGPLLGLLGAAFGAAAPLVYVEAKRRARRERLLNQLPGAFDLMARVIRAGQSVPQALQAVADAFEDPLAGEFASCQKQQNLGLRPEVTFKEMAQRTGILEVRIFVMALLIQRQTGGNLAEVLERLAGLVRDRQRLRRRVKTLTAEGRMQGVTLLVLPFVVFAAMMVINRTYAEVLLKHVPLLVGTAVSMGIGAVWIRKIVNFEP